MSFRAGKNSPDGEQERQMRRFAGSCWLVFNKAQMVQKKRCEQGEKQLGYAELYGLLTEWRNNCIFLPKLGWLCYRNSWECRSR
jgi:hypothetical protein